ncbi:MAG TPA: glycoside hydrolase family 43 protein [Jatrophihabitans sp.]|jgi:beta-xylosidase|uniref:glycoside hydrolase family 43 protein n=1 Tax=Jatrophihabitans sp. TaxID=1932789 RepID=UPI002F0AD304
MALAAVLLAGACEGSKSQSAPSPGATTTSQSGASSSPAKAADTVLGRPYQNPVYEENFPDPAALRVGNRYYAYATQGGGSNIQVLTSPDLIHWTAGPDALPQVGRWASGGKTWAPEVLAVGGKYVLFYTEHDQKSDKQCIGRAQSNSPGGPFVDNRPAPLVCQPALGGSIDPNPIRGADGALYLYWKNDGNCCGKPVQLWVQRLSPDAGSLRGSPVALLSNTRSWQGNLIEAPEMVTHGGRYYLFYSANDYGSDKYAVGYASCRGPIGPCADKSEQPLLSSAAMAAGPGHPFVLDLADGSSVMLFHAWPPDAIGSAVPGRQLWLEPLRWVGGEPRMSPPD